MATKMEEPISHVKGWVNDQIKIVFVRFYYWVLHGAWVLIPLRTRNPDWESGMGLVQLISCAKIVSHKPTQPYPF